VTLTLRRKKRPLVKKNQADIPQMISARYLGLHLDNKLSWRSHAEKDKTSRSESKKINWLLGRKSHLSIENKLIIYKGVIKLIWMCVY
jgi:dihydrofolate reductase